MQRESDKGHPLRITVFFECGSMDTQDYRFCSWYCLFDWLKNIPLNKKAINFLNIDHIGGMEFSFEEEYDAFFEAIMILLER